MRMGKAHGQTVDSLDPATHENGFTIAMTHGYNNYLTEVAPDGSLVGQLAESWDASADAATWTFQLPQRRDLPQRPGGDGRGCRRLHQPSPRRGFEVRRQADRLADHRHQGRRQAHRGLHPRCRQCGLSVHRQRLPPADHAERKRQAGLAVRHRRGSVQDQELRAGRAHRFWRDTRTTGIRAAGTSTRSG